MFLYSILVTFPKKLCILCILKLNKVKGIILKQTMHYYYNILRLTPKKHLYTKLFASCCVLYDTLNDRHHKRERERVRLYYICNEFVRFVTLQHIFSILDYTVNVMVL